MVGGVVGGAGVSDGSAIHYEFDAAVALAAFGGVVGGDGLGFSEAAGGNGKFGHTLVREEIADGAGAALGELLVEVVGAYAVGVAFDLEIEAGVSEENS